MSDAAELPGLMTVAERIEDANVRYSVAFLADEQVRCRSEIRELRLGQNQVLAMLSTISGQLSGIRSLDDAHARVLWPLPPQMIDAVSSHSSPLSDMSQQLCSQPSQSLSQTLSSSASSGKSVKRRRHREVSDRVWLKCPFCPSEHWNEKSHVQHVERAMERYVSVLVCMPYGVFMLKQDQAHLRWWLPSHSAVAGSWRLCRGVQG